ncbi:hypothetical protein COT97_00380 [Candidatus Falkowbacteria bacterium CG10_big_fil_rev_8_21_14_0_10_39_11]|uniref:SprT-like domain-containing protein n=1 Tax=Candidatus Falkowbacteria bacterium CG10_big_fil_rev_8_21_14_0_10_39_11 TaxID=1974565 RepID=A0A2H0V663_9BACT|nr:MAG: hypothetical protein COT97_00380 [Candidatus Falkowbacteria bacterium CG10_big_fil_rev_8_21_14_0_10_39_11]
MTLYKNERYHEFVELVFHQIVNKLFRYKNYKLHIINRRKPANPDSLTLGYINFKKKIIALDIFTPKTHKPKSINSLLRTLAHEIAHIQKPPYYQRYKGRNIVRQHFPAFYNQVDKNIVKIKKDPYFKQYFRQ